MGLTVLAPSCMTIMMVTDIFNPNKTGIEARFNFAAMVSVIGICYSEWGGELVVCSVQRDIKESL